LDAITNKILYDDITFACLTETWQYDHYDDYEDFVVATSAPTPKLTTHTEDPAD
jgi:hypothetical protein